MPFFGVGAIDPLTHNAHDVAFCVGGVGWSPEQATGPQTQWAQQASQLWLIWSMRESREATSEAS